MGELLTIADEIDATSDEVTAWAVGPDNNGPYSHEIYVACAQVVGAFNKLSAKLRARSGEHQLPRDSDR